MRSLLRGGKIILSMNFQVFSARFHIYISGGNDISSDLVACAESFSGFVSLDTCKVECQRWKTHLHSRPKQTRVGSRSSGANTVYENRLTIPDTFWTTSQASVKDFDLSVEPCSFKVSRLNSAVDFSRNGCELCKSSF